MSPSTPIVTIPRNDPRYPRYLAQIADPPQHLYCRGNIALLDTFCLAVVGTRKTSDYGRQACADIAGVLARSGATIVSGLALGIDACAHRAALDASAPTIAVLGAGVDDATVGPPQNKGLARDILTHDGLIVSEHPGARPAERWTFPKRNRIISGLSRGVLVVEGDLKSGSLITAKCALDQNRDVFAVPGSIYWPRSVGTNWLISQGAHLVTSGNDVLALYNMAQQSLPKLGLSTDDPVQQSILAVLREQGPASLDSLIAQSGHDASHVMAAVSLLELAQSIVSKNGVYRIVGAS